MLGEAPVTHCMARDLDVTPSGSATLENKLPCTAVKTRRSRRAYMQSTAQFYTLYVSLCLSDSVSVSIRIYADLGGGGKKQG